MRLWHVLVVCAGFTLACGNMDEMMGGVTGGEDEAEETEDEAEEEEAEEEEEEEEAEKVEKECTTAALGSADGASRLKGGKLSRPKCAGRWASADVSGVGKALFEFNNGWRVVGVGPKACTKPTTRICQTLGFE